MTYQFKTLTKPSTPIIAAHCDGPDGSEALARYGRSWAKGPLSREDAEKIFAINRQILRPCAEWAEFFIDAISRHVLTASEPKGLCSNKDVMWLMNQIDYQTRLETMVDIELLVRVIERAKHPSAELKRFALDKIEMAVLTDVGPTRSEEAIFETRICESECTLTRRIIFASGESPYPSVSRDDAELLFRLKDATLGSRNAGEWAQLFVDGMAAFLERCIDLNCTAQSDAECERCGAGDIEVEDFIAYNRANVGRFMRRVMKDIPALAESMSSAAIVAAAGPNAMEQHTLPQRAGESGDNATETQSWLDAQIAADGPADALEQALIERLQDDLPCAA